MKTGTQTPNFKLRQTMFVVCLSSHMTHFSIHRLENVCATHATTTTPPPLLKSTQKIFLKTVLFYAKDSR